MVWYGMDSQEHLNRVECQRVVTKGSHEVQLQDKGVDECEKNDRCVSEDDWQLYNCLQPVVVQYDWKVFN